MEYQQHGCLFSMLLQKVHGAVQTEVTDRCFPGAKLRVLVPVDLAGNWKLTIFEKTIPYKWVCKIGYSQIQWFIYIGLCGFSQFFPQFMVINLGILQFHRHTRISIVWILPTLSPMIWRWVSHVYPIQTAIHSIYQMFIPITWIFILRLIHLWRFP